MSYHVLAETLGIRRLGESPMELVEVTRKGLRKKAIESLAKALGISLSELSHHLPVSERTLQRYKATEHLDKDLSDHVVQIARAVSRSVEVFGDRGTAAQWLKQPSVALGNVPPLELFDTFTGIEMVLDELTRIEYGVVA